MSTPTPRTDAKLLTVAQRTSPHFLPEMVWADFARELERELADQAARFHDEIVSRQGTARANQELDLKERDQLRTALATERETSRLLRVAMDVRDEGYTQSRRHMSALERDLAAERARLDWLHQLVNESRVWNRILDAVNIRTAIDAAMKEGVK